MELPRNRFKQGLASGKPQFGLWLGIPDNTAAEICAQAGFDWLLIDGEHAPFDIRTIMAHLQAMAPYDVAPVVRAVEGDVALIKRLLDIGAQTLLIPMVETAEQARLLVRAVRYPPEGIRGLGTSLARAARWNQIPDYLHRADAEICLIVQVETRAALENLDDILQVDGIDAVFIGPSDLSASLGHLGNPGHPEVIEAIETSLRIITDAGRYAGLLSLDPSMVSRFVEKGASFIGVGVDTMLLARATRKVAEQYKRGCATDPDERDPPPTY